VLRVDTGERLKEGKNKQAAFNRFDTQGAEREKRNGKQKQSTRTPKQQGRRTSTPT